MKPRLAGGLVPASALARGATRLAQNLLGMHTESAVSAAPAFVTWALTERCPLRCHHCEMGTPTDEMSHEQRLALAHAIGESDVWAVSMIGGEPTLIKELAQYVAVLKAHRKYVTMGTSGVGLLRHLDALIAARIDAIVFSVDSHEPAEHDAFRRREGLFATILEAMEFVRERRRDGVPALHVRCTIHRGNFRSCGAFLDYWTPRVENVVFQVVQDNGIHHVRDESVLFRDEDRPELERVLKETATRYPHVRGSYFELMPRYVFEPEALQRDIGFRCLLVPATSLVVLPDGGAKLCYGRADSVVGSVLTSSVEEIWRSVTTRRTQQRMQSKDYGCMCWESACGNNVDLLRATQGVERVRGWFPTSGT